MYIILSQEKLERQESLLKAQDMVFFQKGCHPINFFRLKGHLLAAVHKLRHPFLDHFRNPLPTVIMSSFDIPHPDDSINVQDVVWLWIQAKLGPLQ